MVFTAKVDVDLPLLLGGVGTGVLGDGGALLFVPAVLFESFSSLRLFLGGVDVVVSPAEDLTSIVGF